MTGEDHNTDALVAALRSPALRTERLGEAAAVTAMIEAQTVPVPSTWLRSRRGVTIAAVTVASLGLGGLAAAGPGIFSPAADQPEITSPTPSTMSAALNDDDREQGDDVDTTSPPEVGSLGIDRISDDPDVECADGNHGQTVSSVAQATDGDPEAVRAAAQSDCGMPDRDGAEDADVECAEGNHGDTVSSIAKATEPDPEHGAIVSEAARSNCGKADGDAPGQSGDAPGQTGDTPGKSGDTPAPPKPIVDSGRPDTDGGGSGSKKP